MVSCPSWGAALVLVAINFRLCEYFSPRYVVRGKHSTGDEVGDGGAANLELATRFSLRSVVVQCVAHAHYTSYIMSIVNLSERRQECANASGPIGGWWLFREP